MVDHVLVNGCSFSRGPTAWPYFLKTVDQDNVVNLACAGAGNTYIHETTVNAVASWPFYDLVLVMWTNPARVDMKVADVNLFSSSAYTSSYQSTRNDWPEKRVEPFNDQALVEKDWIFGCGHINGETAITGSRAFEGVYRYQDPAQFEYHFVQKIVATQSFLKHMGIPYVFMFYKNFVQDLQKDISLYKMIDWHRCFIDDNINDIAVRNTWFDSDGIHPGIKAHQLWASKLDEFIKESNA